MGPAGPLRALAEAGELPSLILWGPPGCGKTTIARLLASQPGLRCEALSAVTAGVKEIRETVESARRERRRGLRTVLVIDEIHRLNRAQQDALLPHVEAGSVTLIGATTENPSFEVIAPLLSRCRVFTLARLEQDALAALRARARPRTPSAGSAAAASVLGEDAANAIAAAADGDARRALGLLEAAATLHLRRAPRGAPLALEAVREAAGRALLVHDRDREEHYNVVSALIKSLRASDPDAALYYAARMLAAGEDPALPGAPARDLRVRGRRQRRAGRAPARDLRLPGGRAHRHAGGAHPARRRRSPSWPARRRATPPTSASSARARGRASAARCRCRCTCATRRPV